MIPDINNKKPYFKSEKFRFPEESFFTNLQCFLTFFFYFHENKYLFDQKYRPNLYRNSLWVSLPCWNIAVSFYFPCDFLNHGNTREITSEKWEYLHNYDFYFFKFVFFFCYSVENYCKNRTIS